MSLPKELKTLELLGQLWASMNPAVSDYACNAMADKLAELDLLIEELKEAEDDPEVREVLEELQRERERIKRLGEALWLMESDVLTNLSVKVGRRRMVISGVRRRRGS